jgi:hypothetical protein
MRIIRIAAIAAAGLLTGAALHAQTLYDADRLTGSDLNGTARFVGMGGAMGALGGDMSTMSTNPAGIGLYRSNDVAISFGLANNGTRSVFDNNTVDTDKSHGSFENIGFVLSNKIGNSTPLRYINVGFNYHKPKSFDRNMSMEGGALVSQTQQFASMVNNNVFISPDEMAGKDAFFLDFVPWLGVMAYDAHLLTFDGSKERYDPYLLEDNSVFSKYSSVERGGIDNYDINIALNLYDRLYVGATLGAYSVDYTRHTSYSETFYVQDMFKNEDDGRYTLQNNYALEGSGVDFKLGFILRPVQTSSLRLGAAIHTPTWYQLRERHFARLSYRTYVSGSETPARGETFPQSANGNPMEGETEYRITTPWKYNFSWGYTIGRDIALGAEYEYSDHSSSTLRYNDGVRMEGATKGIKEGLKGVQTIRIGAECKLSPELSFRLGYNHSTASVYNNTFKSLPNNAIRTDTEFSNGKAVNNYTLGFGYRKRSVYVDMAYLYNNYKESFYAFDHENLPATTVTNNNQKVVITLGARF